MPCGAVWHDKRLYCLVIYWLRPARLPCYHLTVAHHRPSQSTAQLIPPVKQLHRHVLDPHCIAWVGFNGQTPLQPGSSDPKLQCMPPTPCPTNLPVPFNLNPLFFMYVVLARCGRPLLGPTRLMVPLKVSPGISSTKLEKLSAKSQRIWRR